MSVPDFFWLTRACSLCLLAGSLRPVFLARMLFLLPAARRATVYLVVPSVPLLGDSYMRPVQRSHVNKRSSAGKFRGNVSRTHPRNVAPPPMRGGYRL